MKSYLDLVCYEWAKAIARSAGMKDNFAFIMDRMTKLKGGELHMSDIVREERLMAVEGRKECAYCGAAGELTWDHLIPTSKGGLNTLSHHVPVQGVQFEQRRPGRNRVVSLAKGRLHPEARLGKVPETDS